MQSQSNHYKHIPKNTRGFTCIHCIFQDLISCWVAKIKLVVNRYLKPTEGKKTSKKFRVKKPSYRFYSIMNKV